VNMRFEARDLKPYVERVRTADLVVGRPYFRVGFIDENMVVPDLESLVFIGRDLNPEGPGLYFQDAVSFLEGKRFDPADFGGPFPAADDATDHFTLEMDDTWVDVYPERENSGVLDIERALECLMHCSLRHRTWDGTLRPIPHAALD
jgi:hypothetical protein